LGAEKSTPPWLGIGGTWATSHAAVATPLTTVGGATRIGSRTGKG